MDEFAIHNVELSLSEIQQHYTNGLSGLGYFETAPQQHWQLWQNQQKLFLLGFDSPQIEIHDLKVYPNPFSDRLRFEFVATEDVNARIDMYDMSGRMVKTIFEQPVQADMSYEAEFKPETTISGMYIYRMVMGDAVFNGKVVFRK